MPLYDFRCLKCRTVHEVFADTANGLSHPCECGGVAVHVWLKAPGVIGDLVPYHDVQLGKWVSSRQHRDALLKERGLIAMGPDELRRTSSQAHDESTPKFNREAFKEAALKAYSDVKNGNVPLEEAPATEEAAVFPAATE